MRRRRGYYVPDVATKETKVLWTLYRVVLAEKRAGRVVHLSIAGGRKTMAAYGMVVAQLLFDDEDRVWHLHSENWRPGSERVMHARPGDAISLLPVPVLRWSSVSPFDDGAGGPGGSVGGNTARAGNHRAG